MPDHRARAFAYICAKLGGTVIVGVKDDQDPTPVTRFFGCEQQMAPKIFVLVEEAIAVYTYGRGNIGMAIRRSPLSKTSQQDG